MMQSKGIGRPRGGVSGNANKAGVPPQVVLVELKNRILAALNKLSDRDTQQIALEDLESIGQSLSAEGISLFLSCLYDTDLQQKAVVRRECVKLFATLASMHGDCMAPHLPRIVGNIVRRLKDPDSAIREVCVDVIGTLAAQVVPGSGGEAPAAAVGVYIKPLLEALSEQNKGVQVGASLCLSRVLDRVENIPTASLQRLVPRILKFMSLPSFLAKAGLLSVIASLAQALGAAGAAGTPLLTALVPCTQECLEHTDWATRKAAADTLLRMALSLGPALSPFKATIMASLEACRFDKVKPVRDSVNDAMAVWKNVPGGDSEEASGGRHGGKSKSAGDSPSVTSSLSSLPRYSDSDPSFASRTTRALFPLSEGASSSHLLNSSPDHPTARKRSPQLSDRKTNPDFFRKLDNCSDELQIEVCGGRPPPRSHFPVEEAEEVVETARNKHHLQGNHVTTVVSTYSSIEVRPGAEYGDIMDSQPAFNIDKDHKNHDTGSTEEEMSNDQALKAVEPYSSWSDKVSSELNNGGHTWEVKSALRSSLSPSNGDFDVRTANDPSMWTAIRRHLQQIERQQSQLMDMFQDFVASSQEGMLGLESTVHNLERAVEKVTQDMAAVFGRAGPDALVGFGRGNSFPGEAFHGAGPDYTVSGDDGAPPVPLAGMRSGEKYPPWMVEKGSLILDEYCYGSPGLARLAGNESPLKSPAYYPDLQGENSRPNLEADMMSRRGWETREAKTPSRSEGGSTRSVWQSANDHTKATLAAIRGAGFQGGDPEGMDTDLSKLDLNGLAFYNRTGEQRGM